MLTILGTEFTLPYVLLLIALGAAAYFFILRSPPPPPQPIKIKIAATSVKAAPKVKAPEVIPEDTQGKIKILYGTQTGTAEDFSRTLAKEARRYKIYAKLVDMELYDVKELPNEPYVLIVTSTHGEGEPPDTAKTFYKHLGSELSPTLLEKVNYSVFGLGNKTYEHYNAVGRYMDAKMSAHGAKQFLERGEGDDDCSLEEDFNKWKKKLWPALCKHMGLNTSDANLAEEKFVPSYKISVCPPSAAGKFSLRGGLKKSNKDGSPVYDIKNPLMATVAVNRELHTKSSDRSCRHIEIQIGDSLKYEAGDHLGIYPENAPAIVEQMGRRIQADLDQVIALVPTVSTLPANLNTEIEVKAAAETSVLGPSTLRQILTDAIDILAIPRKSLLKSLADYTSDPKEKEQLLVLAKDGEHDEYSRWIKQDHRTIMEVLIHFPSCNPPLPALLELLPRLTPRFYSISSSSNAHPGSVHVTSVVVRFNTPTGREHAGVCSTWLADLPPGTHVPVFVRESNFKLPAKPGPVIMVGPGTGLAPFRGFLQELKYRRETKGETDWDAELFFGCRHREHDYIYEDELNEFQADHTVSQLHVAFSREQGHKVYVQDKLDAPDVRERLWRFLNEQNGHFYVCGDARVMAKAVNQVLVKIAKECGNMTEEQANAYVEHLHGTGRYSQDVWF